MKLANTIGISISRHLASVAGFAGRRKVPRLKVVTQSNSILKDVDTLPGTTGKLMWQGRIPRRIGSGAVTELDPFFPNWIINDSRNGLCTNTGNILTAVAVAAEYNGVTKPITFNGGARSAIIPDGGGIFPDPLSAQAFGLESFPLDAVIYINIRLLIPALGTDGVTKGKLPYSSNETGAIPGSQSKYWDPTKDTVVSSVDTPGAITSTGTVPEDRIIMYCPLMFGKHLSADTMTWLYEGDSIGAGVGDSVQDTVGSGAFNRYARTNKLASLNLCVGGSRAVDGLFDPRIAALYPMCDVAAVNYGTNNPESAAVVIDLLQQRVARHKANGILRTLIAKRTPIAVKIDQAVGWTLANQTGAAITEIKALNDAIDAALVSGKFYGALNHDSIRAADGRWIENGTVDGTHPSNLGYTAMYNEDIPKMNAAMAA